MGPFGAGTGEGVGLGGLRFFADVGVRFVTGFLIPRPVYEPNVKNHYRGLSRYREGYANRAATGRYAC